MKKKSIVSIEQVTTHLKSYFHDVTRQLRFIHFHEEKVVEVTEIQNKSNRFDYFYDVCDASQKS